MFLGIGDTIDNQTVCATFGVANMGGIRVNSRRNLIVLVSNNTDTTYRNEWIDGDLHFVGMGAVGPQRLDRQNRTLANSRAAGATLYLFEVFETSRYVYAGEVEVIDDPYLTERPDAQGRLRLAWVFKLRKKRATNGPEPNGSSVPNHLPFEAYAVIGSNLTEEQRRMVNDALDRLREAGISVFDRRDVERNRYDKRLCEWQEAVLDHVRAYVRDLVEIRKKIAKSGNRAFGLIDDELKINSGSTEQELRAALKLLDRDDPISAEHVFEEARRAVPFPDPPSGILDADREQDDLPEIPKSRPAVACRFRDFK
ncbi:hypothetical protein [Bradyrhizobium sp. CCGUVB23]|uniref:hypothetical protein n=1 Tax=Bradyrhizobium sp. CCGUVB23 TaxID=2949630 RepID=UPI0020B408A4|nr:hypothetical protein [Bradyrhizobium sp. CCGUVB23]MCP3462144.1 hypothetical protein [Bradyrhizobium sp. CCGUVB23]